MSPGCFRSFLDAEESLEEKMDVFSRLEAEFQTLIDFVTPNEAGQIKARLMQIGRYGRSLRTVWSNKKQSFTLA